MNYTLLFLFFFVCVQNASSQYTPHIVLPGHQEEKHTLCSHAHGLTQKMSEKPLMSDSDIDVLTYDVFMDWRLDPWLCNVIKYVQRHHKKNGIEDLQKALHYLEFAIENYDKIKKAYYERD